MSTASAPMPDSHHRSRHLPPFAGGAQTTGWEALDKWVGEGKAPAKAAASSSGGASSGCGFMGWLKRLFGGR